MKRTMTVQINITIRFLAHWRRLAGSVVILVVVSLGGGCARAGTMSHSEFVEDKKTNAVSEVNEAKQRQEREELWQKSRERSQRIVVAKVFRMLMGYPPSAQETMLEILEKKTSPEVADAVRHRLEAAAAGGGAMEYTQRMCKQLKAELVELRSQHLHDLSRVQSGTAEHVRFVEEIRCIDECITKLKFEASIKVGRK